MSTDDPNADPNGHDTAPRDGTPGDSRSLPRWLVPGLIGLVTITAGLLTWQAGQLGSSAAFEDRQSVGQTITQQTQVTEAGLATLNQAAGYVSYTADLAEAAALEDLASEAASQGRPDVSDDLRRQAEVIRTTSTRIAAASKVFGQPALLEQQLTGSTDAAPFDVMDRFESNRTAIASRLRSPGVLEPQMWADRADDTRERVRSLRWGTLFMLVAVAAYTVAELARRRTTRMAGFAVGGLVYLATLALVVPGAW